MHAYDTTENADTERREKESCWHCALEIERELQLAPSNKFQDCASLRLSSLASDAKGCKLDDPACGNLMNESNLIQRQAPFPLFEHHQHRRSSSVLVDWNSFSPSYDFYNWKQSRGNPQVRESNDEDGNLQQVLSTTSSSSSLHAGAGPYGLEQVCASSFVSTSRIEQKRSVREVITQNDLCKCLRRKKRQQQQQWQWQWQLQWQLQYSIGGKQKAARVAEGRPCFAARGKPRNTRSSNNNNNNKALDCQRRSQTLATTTKTKATVTTTTKRRRRSECRTQEFKQRVEGKGDSNKRAVTALRATEAGKAAAATTATATTVTSGTTRLATDRQTESFWRRNSKCHRRRVCCGKERARCDNNDLYQSHQHRSQTPPAAAAAAAVEVVAQAQLGATNNKAAHQGNRQASSTGKQFSCYSSSVSSHELRHYPGSAVAASIVLLARTSSGSSGSSSSSTTTTKSTTISLNAIKGTGALFSSSSSSSSMRQLAKATPPLTPQLKQSQQTSTCCGVSHQHRESPRASSSSSSSSLSSSVALADKLQENLVSPVVVALPFTWAPSEVVGHTANTAATASSNWSRSSRSTAGSSSSSSSISSNSGKISSSSSGGRNERICSFRPPEVSQHRAAEHVVHQQQQQQRRRRRHDDSLSTGALISGSRHTAPLIQFKQPKETSNQRDAISDDADMTPSTVTSMTNEQRQAPLAAVSPKAPRADQQRSSSSIVGQQLVGRASSSHCSSASASSSSSSKSAPRRQNRPLLETPRTRPSVTTSIIINSQQQQAKTCLVNSNKRISDNNNNNNNNYNNRTNLASTQASSHSSKTSGHFRGSKAVGSAGKHPATASLPLATRPHPPPVMSASQVSGLAEAMTSCLQASTSDLLKALPQSISEGPPGSNIHSLELVGQKARMAISIYDPLPAQQESDLFKGAPERPALVGSTQAAEQQQATANNFLQRPPGAAPAAQPERIPSVSRPTDLNLGTAGPSCLVGPRWRHPPRSRRDSKYGERFLKSPTIPEEPYEWYAQADESEAAERQQQNKSSKQSQVLEAPKRSFTPNQERQRHAEQNLTDGFLVATIEPESGGSSRTLFVYPDCTLDNLIHDVLDKLIEIELDQQSKSKQRAPDNGRAGVSSRETIMGKKIERNQQKLIKEECETKERIKDKGKLRKLKSEAEKLAKMLKLHLEQQHQSQEQETPLAQMNGTDDGSSNHNQHQKSDPTAMSHDEQARFFSPNRKSQSEHLHKPQQRVININKSNNKLEDKDKNDNPLCAFDFRCSCCCLHLVNQPRRPDGESWCCCDCS